MGGPGRKKRDRDTSDVLDKKDGAVVPDVAALLQASPAASGCAWSALTGVKLHSLVQSFLAENLSFPTTTPVQARTIPLLLTNRDVVVEAMTGSGKTLAYLVPAVEMMLTPRCRTFMKNSKCAIAACVVLPSRELAIQVHHVAKTFLQHINKHMPALPVKEGGGANAVKMTTACYIGGRSMEKDVEIFKETGANLLIGTPGRLYELLVTSKYATIFETAGLELLILDEADKLLEFGFKAKLDSLLKRLPKQRRTGLFSATQTKELADIARTGMRNPMAVSVRSSNAHELKEAGAPLHETKPQVPEQLENFYTVTSLERKHDALVEFLVHNPNEKILLYMLTCAAVDWFALALPEILKVVAERRGEDPTKIRPVYGLHGQLPMKERNSVHKTLRGETSHNAIAICTDVAARGLDIPDVTVVIQYDAPVAPSTFIHRIGRTARMGKIGKSLVFLLPHETEYIEFLKLQQVRLSPLVEVDSDDEDLSDAEGDGGEGKVNVRRTLASAKPMSKGRGKGATKEAKRAAKVKQQNKNRPKLRDATRAVNEADLPCESEAILAMRRASTTTNSTINDLGLRAFVSFLRAYKEHECRYIFQLRKVDIIHLVHYFALFSVPNCGELRRMGRMRIPLQEEFTDYSRKLKSAARARAVQRTNEKLAKENERERQDMELTNTNRLHNVKTSTIANEAHLKKEKIKAQATSHKKLGQAWKQAELEELMQEAYLVKKEKQGRIKSKRVDELSGNDAIENAMLSTRDRKDSRKLRRPSR